MYTRATTSAVFAAFLCIVLASPASAATAVVCGTTSSADGEKLKLTGNLVCAGTAVTITHDKVHFNLAGFTITGDGSGIGVDACNTPTSRVHINGGTVTGFEHGIKLCMATKAHINGMTVTDNVKSGIELVNSDNNRINGSTLTSNGMNNIGGASTDGGLVLIGSDNNTIHTMTIEDNVAFGVLFRFSGGNIITSSDLTNNELSGIFADRAGGNTILGNTITGPSVQGINVSSGGGFDTIQDNNVTGTNTGIALRNFQNGTVRSNTSSDNVSSGIVIFGSSFNTLLQSNTALGNPFIDVSDTSSPAQPPCHNIWKDNTFVTANDPGGCIQ